MKTWFITGTSKGFGRVWAEVALERGDQVVATARTVEKLAPIKEKYGKKILALQLDVTNKQQVEDVVKEAREHFGKLDVVINNAGYDLFGAVEEVSENEAREQLETNVFGALWVTQAVLPMMREQQSGHIIQVSSIGGVNAFPSLGLYHASKWALEGFSQSLSQEVAGFGIKVTLVEPGSYGTDWGTVSAAHAQPLEAYQPLRDMMAKMSGNNVPANPQATGSVMLQLVDMEQPPLRMFFGKGMNEMIHGEYQKRLDEWDAHKDLSEQAQS